MPKAHDEKYDPERYISAAELEKFSYCPLSWWLSLGIKAERGEEAAGREDMALGEKKHKKVGKSLQTVVKAEKKIVEWEKLIFVFAVGATIISIFGIVVYPQPWEKRLASFVLAPLSLIWLLAAALFMTIDFGLGTFKHERLILGFSIVATLLSLYAVAFYSPKSPVVAYGIEALALFWLIFSVTYLYSDIRSARAVERLRTATGVGSAEIAYVDTLSPNVKVLRSDLYRISGRPDYVIKEAGYFVPVEIKTGRVPRGPLFSHIVQIAAYCMIVEECFGLRPPYGIIRYGDTEYKIDFDEELEKLVVQKLKEMRETLTKKEAHRNHNRVGKCLHCSRRDGCPEALG